LNRDVASKNRMKLGPVDVPKDFPKRVLDVHNTAPGPEGQGWLQNKAFEMC